MLSDYVMPGVTRRVLLCNAPSTRRPLLGFPMFPCRLTYDLVLSLTANGTRCRCNRSNLSRDHHDDDHNDSSECVRANCRYMSYIRVYFTGVASQSDETRAFQLLTMDLYQCMAE